VGVLKTRETYRQKGNFDRAITDFDEAVRLDPKSAFAVGSRGQAYRQKGQYDRAISDLDEAIRIDRTIAWPIADAARPTG